MTRRRSSRSAVAPPPRPRRTASGAWMLALLCGSAALIYEIVWSRYLSLVFGVSAYAVATVLACFMLGLALGNWHVGRRLDRGASAARTLQCLLGVLGLYMALSFAVYSLFQYLSHGILRGLPDEGAAGIAGHAVRFGLAFAVLLLPTYCIGGTFPALVRWAAAQSGDRHPNVAWVYGFNTLGGVLGALLAGFVLISSLGMSASLWLAAGLTFLAGGYIWRNARHRATAGKQAPALSPPPAMDPPDEQMPAHLRRLALGVCAISGLTALACQVLWTRILTLFFRDTVYDFTIVLAVFLGGLVLGSLACQKFLRRQLTAAHALGWIQMALGASVLLGLHLVAQLPYLLNDLQTNKSVVERYGTDFWSAALAIRLGYALLLMLPATCLFGAAFPMAARVWMAPPRAPDLPARGLGLLTAVNGLGAAAGAVLAGFLIVPLLGIQHSLILLAALNVAAGLAMLLALWRRNRGFLFTLASLSLAFLIVSAPAWDRRRMSVGFLDQNQPLEDILDLTFYQEDSAGITSVVEIIPLQRQKYLVTNRAYAQNSSDLGGLQDHRRLGAIPLLLHGRPRQVLAVGLGAGITLRGVMALDPQAATVVEILPGVVQAARRFAAENNHVLENPKVQVVVQDGRNYLGATDRRFDVIVLDILHPMSSGSSSVFSRQYYQLCRDRLAAGGLVCQWLPVHQLGGDELRTIMRTFQAVFPHATVWYGLLGDSTQVVGLVGTLEPLSVDPQALSDRFAGFPAGLQDELRAVNLGNPALLLSHFVMGEAAAARFCAGAELDTDDRPVIEFAAPRLAVTAERQGMLNLTALTDSAEPLAAALHAGTLDESSLARYVAGKRAIIQGLRLELAGDEAARQDCYRRALEKDPGNEDLRDITPAH